MEQAECENPVEGVEPIDKPTPVPQADDALPANLLTESQPESVPNSVPKQHKMVNPESTGSTSPGPTNDGLKAEGTTPVPLQQSSRKRRNPH